MLESKGFSLTVTDREILAAQQTSPRGGGVFAEPAAAATEAALKKIQAATLLGSQKTNRSVDYRTRVEGCGRGNDQPPDARRD